MEEKWTSRSRLPWLCTDVAYYGGCASALYCCCWEVRYQYVDISSSRVRVIIRVRANEAAYCINVIYEKASR